MRTVSEPSIAVVTYPYSCINRVQVIWLTKLIELFEPLSRDIFVITGNFPQSSNKKVHIMRVKGDEIKMLGEAQRQLVLNRIIKNMLVQLKTTLPLLKISKNIDIVAFIGGGLQSSLLPMLVSKLMRKKIIVFTYRYDSSPKIAENVRSERLFSIREIVSSYITGLLFNISYGLADQIVVESEHFINFGGLSRYRSKIYNYSAFDYIDTDYLKIKKDLKDRENLVGYIGRFSKEKGVVNFAKAVPLILERHKDIEFLIGGDGPLFDEIKNELKNNGSYDKVELTGWIPYDELPDYLNRLRLLVLPSYVEGLPAIVKEAMACGTPVMATPVGGVPDLIKDEKTGFIMEDNSPECIAENVIRTWEHPNLDGIVKNARKLIKEEYTYELLVKKYRDSLDELMKSK